MSRVLAHIILFGIFCLSLGSPALAQDSEVAIVVPWGSIEKDFNQWSQSLQKNWSDELTAVVVPVDGLDIQLPKVKVQALIQGSSLRAVSERLDYGIQKLMLKLSVSGLNIDQVVERMVDGVVVRVHVHVRCDAFELEQTQAQVFARLNPGVSEGKTNPSFDSFHVVWPDNSWTVTNIQCQGPTGMGEKIQTTLLSRLKNSEDFRPELEKIVLKKIQSEVMARISKWSSPQLVAEGAESLLVQLKQIQSHPKGLVFLSVLSDPKKPGTQPVSLEWDNRTWEQIPEDSPSLLLPTVGIEKLLLKRWQREPDWMSLSLNSIKSFNRLLKSRFLQFFVWSDLWNYSKSSPFTLQMQRPQSVPVSWDDNGRAQVRFNAGAWIQSVRDGKTWNYIGLSSPVKIDLQMQIQQGNLRLGGHAELQDVQTYVGAEYEQKYGRPWFSRSIVEEALKSAVERVSIGLQLPSLQFNDSTQYTANGWKGLDRKTILVPWVLKKNDSDSTPADRD